MSAGNLAGAAAAVGAQTASVYLNTTNPTDGIATGPSRAISLANRLVTSNGTTPAPFLAPPGGPATLPAHTSRTNEPRIALSYAAIGLGFTCISDGDVVFARGVTDIANATHGEVSRRVPSEPLPAGGYAVNEAMANSVIASYQLARLVKRKNEQDAATPAHQRIRFDKPQYRPDVSGYKEEIAELFKPLGVVRTQVGSNGGGDVSSFEQGMQSKGYTSQGKLLNIGIAGRNHIQNTSREAIQPGDYIVAVLVPRQVFFNQEYVTGLERPALVIGSSLSSPQQQSTAGLFIEDRVPGDNPWLKLQTRPTKKSLSSEYFAGLYDSRPETKGAGSGMTQEATMNTQSSAIIFQWEIYPMFNKHVPEEIFKVDYDMFIDDKETVRATVRDHFKCIVAVARAPYKPHRLLGEHKLAQRISKATNLSRDYQSLRAESKTEAYVFANHIVTV